MPSFKLCTMELECFFGVCVCVCVCVLCSSYTDLYCAFYFLSSTITITNYVDHSKYHQMGLLMKTKHCQHFLYNLPAYFHLLTQLTNSYRKLI